MHFQAWSGIIVNGFVAFIAPVAVSLVAAGYTLSVAGVMKALRAAPREPPNSVLDPRRKCCARISRTSLLTVSMPCGVAIFVYRWGDWSRGGYHAFQAKTPERGAPVAGRRGAPVAAISMRLRVNTANGHRLTGGTSGAGSAPLGMLSAVGTPASASARAARPRRPRPRRPRPSSGALRAGSFGAVFSERVQRRVPLLLRVALLCPRAPS